MMLRTAWILARKDLKLFFRDRTALLLTLALPILLATVFGSAMSGMMGGGSGSGEPKKVRVVVEDLDGTPASETFVQTLEASGGLRVERSEDVRRQVKNGDVAAAIVVPRGYGERLASGEVPKVQLLRDPSQLIAQQVIAGNLLPVLFEATVQNVGPELARMALEEIGFPKSGLAEANAIMSDSWSRMDEVVTRLMTEGAFTPAEEPEPEAAENEGEGSGFNFLEDVPALLGLEAVDVVGEETDAGPSRSAGVSHAIAAMAVMMLMFSLVGAGGSLLEERDGGTLLRLQLTPSAGPAILTGKMIMLGLCGLLQLVTLFAYGWFVFDVPVPQYVFRLTLISLLLVFASMGLGLVFATGCTTRKQMEGLSTLVILVMSAVGGAWFPREVTPDWFRTVGLLSPTSYAMDAYHGVLWYGKGILPSGELDGIWVQLVVLFGIGALLNALAYRLYQRRFVEQA